MTKIGVVGLGAMGSRIAGRLLSQGNSVYGTNRTRSKADSMIEQGLLWCESPKATAESADVVLSVVSNSEALEAVTAGPNGILSGLAAGKVYIDMSTVSSQTGEEIAERVAAHGASMLAAPFSGSLQAAEDGTLTIIVGGGADAFERVEPILGQLGSTVIFVGDISQALLVKLAVNVNLAAQMLGLSEGMRLTEQGGVDRELALDMLIGSAINAPLLRERASLELPDKAWFDVHDLFSGARLLGYEHRDIAALFQTLAEMITGPSGRELGFGTRGAR